MKAQHTPGPLFVLNDEPRRIKIVDSQGNEVFSEPRCAWSSNDKTVEDTMIARGFAFKGADRDAAIEANERQLADAYLRAAAPELLRAALLAQAYQDAEDWAIEEVQEAWANQEELYDARDFAIEYIADVRRAAIAKAKGGAA